MFKNLILYRLDAPWNRRIDEVQERLEEGRFVPCPSTQPQSSGWVAPRGEANAPLVEVVQGQWLFRLQVEQRVLPASVVRRQVEEQLAQIEAETGRKPGKKRQQEIKDEVTLTLLPQAFTKRAASMVWLNPETGVLAVDAGSQGRADAVVTHLIQAMPDLAMRLIQTAESPSAVMTAWLLDDTPAAGFTIDRDAELRSGDEQRSVVRYARHALDTDEVKMHIQSGKQVTRMAMTWRERASFVLNEMLQLKKLSLLDLVFEQAPQGKDLDFDANVAIWTGELGGLITELLEGLGGTASEALAAPVAAASAAIADVTPTSAHSAPTDAPW